MFEPHDHDVIDLCMPDEAPSIFCQCRVFGTSCQVPLLGINMRGLQSAQTMYSVYRTSSCKLVDRSHESYPLTRIKQCLSWWCIQGAAWTQRQRAQFVLSVWSLTQWRARQHHQGMGHGRPGVPKNPSWPQGRCDVHCWVGTATPLWSPVGPCHPNGTWCLTGEPVHSHIILLWPNL